MPDPRTEAAVEAAAKAFHENARQTPQFHWEQCGEAWQRDIRNFVRPMVAAALEAADEHMSAALAHERKETR